MLPPDHPLRFELNNEVHARPPEMLVAPLRISYLAVVTAGAAREEGWRQIVALAERYGVAGPAPGANHFSGDLGPFRLKWERHTEFSRYKFILPGADDDPFAVPALTAVPEDWLAGLAGEVMVATHVALLPAGAEAPDYGDIARRLFAGNTLIGAVIAGGAATALTDLRIHGDGFGRLLVLDREMTPRQAGRMVQRLLEIDSYRVMALLALPVAGELAPFLSRCERELVEITTALAGAQERDEPVLLDRLTRLQAAIESRHADNHYRFGAAAAYDDLVQRRIAELREQRIQGLQTFREFTERRLAPAMQTCRAVAARQESLSQRMTRATQLLSTRVDVARERQTQAVLESMNRRARLQLRLQETVEGLSIAAVTYYVVGLVGYAAKGLKAAGVALDPDLIIGISIPVVAILVALGVRKIRKSVTRHVT
jgi:uncharacterized membrane-anchored protein